MILNKLITHVMNGFLGKGLLLAALLFLPMSLLGQSKRVKVAMRSGTELVGELKEFDALDHITLIIAGSESVIPMSEVAYVDQVSASETTTRERVIVPEKVQTSDALAGYKGFLLAKGNSVYVYSGSSKTEVAAAEVLKEYLKKDGFWKVVDDMHQAHFSINYLVNLRDSEKATLSVSSWRTNSAEVLRSSKASESALENEEFVKDLYFKGVVPLEKKIEFGSLSVKLRDYFTIY